MSIAFTRWPRSLEEKYREKGYWIDHPLSHILDLQCENRSIAIVEGEHQISYRKLNESSTNLAANLHSKGLKKGDTALVHLGNTYALYIVFFAMLKLGVVPINALFSHRKLELDSYAKQIQPKLLIGDRQNPLFASDGYITRLKEISPELKVTLFHNSDSADSLRKAWESETADFKPSPTPADEVAFFNLSGGSTGTPKLIPRTHNDYYYSVRESVNICKFDEETRYLVAIPAAHNFPMSSPGALGVFVAGGQVIMANDPSAQSCFPLVERHKINVAALVPPAASLWLQEVNAKGKVPLASLRMLQLGGARLSPTLASKLAEVLECKIQQVFGMAEGLVNYTRLDDDDEHILTTQGYPMCPDDEVWVAGEDGKPVANGEVGLLMTRGPYTFRGYYNSPEYNASSFDSEGFYCSGDLIAIADDGFITIHGRKKDQINRGGEKISTEEIENLLLRHPDVTEAGLVAMDDDLMGEKSCAFIMVRRPIKSVVLRKFLRDQGIAEYKLPDKFKVLEEMPLTAVGKVDKKQLRDQLSKEGIN